MRIQFIGKVSELLAVFRILVTRFPSIRAADVTQGMLTEARFHIQRN